MKRAVRLMAAALALTMFLGVAPSPASAGEKPLDRAKAIERAKKWANSGVPYSQKGYKDGYRRDCSGLVSYAWDLPENLVTWNIPTVSKRIGKGSLKPGDVLLNTKGGAGGRHVVLFDGWTNKKKSEYWAIEQTGQNGVRKAVRRKMPYPYKFDKNLYKPYRYVSMDGYWENVPEKSHRQPVKGYDGRVETPAVAAAKKKAAEKSAAAEKKAAEQRRSAKDRAASAETAEEKRIADAKAAQAKESAERKAAAEKAVAMKKAAAEERTAAETAAAAETTSAGEVLRTAARESARQIVGVLMSSLQNGLVN